MIHDLIRTAIGTLALAAAVAAIAARSAAFQTHDPTCSSVCNPSVVHTVTGVQPSGVHYLISGTPTTGPGYAKPITPCSSCPSELCTYGDFVFEFDGGTTYTVAISRPAGTTLTNHQNPRPGRLSASCGSAVGTDFVQFSIIDNNTVPPQTVYTERYDLGCDC
jgi:hypothetical protein